MSLIVERFVIGTDAGQYPEGGYIQDKMFDNSRIIKIERNEQILNTGYSSANGRLYVEQTLENGEIVLAYAYKSY